MIPLIKYYARVFICWTCRTHDPIFKLGSTIPRFQTKLTPLRWSTANLLLSTTISP